MDNKVKDAVVTSSDILRGGVHGATDEMCCQQLDYVRQHLDELNVEVCTELNQLRRYVKGLDWLVG